MYQQHQRRRKVISTFWNSSNVILNKGRRKTLHTLTTCITSFLIFLFHYLKRAHETQIEIEIVSNDSQ